MNLTELKADIEHELSACTQAVKTYIEALETLVKAQSTETKIYWAIAAAAFVVGAIIGHLVKAL
jgi:uncharacterized membrane protein YoaK (UPF0700 family)